MNYAPLNIKTYNYLLYSTIKIPDLIKAAKENNINALTIVDNNMYGALEFYKACTKNNIKPIIGLEIKIPEKILLYCKNYHGYKNLIKITTIMNEKELTIEDIIPYYQDIICIVPYTSRQRYNEIKKIFENIFIGYTNEEEKSKIKSDNTVYIGEIRVINKEDENYLKYLTAIKENKLAKEINENYQNTSLLPLIKYDTLNNQKIVEMCNLEIKWHQDLLPAYPCVDSYNYLKECCLKGLRKIFGNSAPRKYAERLKYELSVINKMGFCDYFLIVADYINYAKNNGILVGPGRGSAAGSLVAYSLGITTIDPLKYNLLFERFLNPERVTMPDIDVDFEDSRREEVIRYCINKYGNKKVALIVTFGTLASKQAIKDTGRILDVSDKKLDILSKMLDSKKNLKENYQSFNVKDFLKVNSELQKVYKIASKLEGLKRHTSIHAAGIVMSKYDLDENLPLDKTHDGLYATEYDKDYLEELGLLKMDFLGLKNLTLITNILKEIDNLEFDTIPEDDKDALNIFTKVDTIGIFQFESSGMINFLKKFKPETFEDIIAALALFRPGPMRNIDIYIRRRQGKEKVNYFHPTLESILKPTYGIIVYQEQIMQIAHTMAGFTLAEADLLRRAMSKKSEDILLKEKDRFIAGSIKNGYSETLALEIYNLIFKFADYGFNRSHSVAYAMISYKMAYLKAHYPKIFMKNLLSSAINSEIKTKEYIYECKKNNIIIQKPDINNSTDNYIVLDNYIIYPLTNIKNIGITAVKYILKVRNNGKFKDIFDFACRCYGGPVTRKTLESLIHAGAFDNFGYNHKTLIENLDLIINYSEIGNYLSEDVFKPEIERYPEYNKSELMQFELATFGFYLSNHPITEYRLKHQNSIELKDISNYFDKNIEVVVYIDKIKQIETKRQETMVFITGSDELSKVDIVIFPKVYNQIPPVKIGDIVKIKGHVEKRFDQLQIITENLEVLKN